MMNQKIITLIEANDMAALDAMSIRGGTEHNLVTDGDHSFVGYDYENQCWIEHTWNGVQS